MRHVRPKRGDAYLSQVAAGGKECKACKTFKPLEDYYVIKRKGNEFPNFTGKCRTCFKEYHKGWVEENRDRYQSKIREWQIRTNYCENKYRFEHYGPIIELMLSVGYKLNNVSEKRIGWIAEAFPCHKCRVKRALEWANAGDNYDKYLNWKKQKKGF